MALIKIERLIIIDTTKINMIFNKYYLYNLVVSVGNAINKLIKFHFSRATPTNNFEDNIFIYKQYAFK